MENPLDSRIPVIAQAVEEWKQQNTEKALADKTKRLLDTHSEQVVLKLLGFNKDRWHDSTWDLDHCNGRAGNSPAGDYLKQAQAETIKEWLSTTALPKLSKPVLAKLHKNLLSEFEDCYARSLRGLVHSEANKAAKAFFDKLVSESAINKHMQAMELISPTK